MTRRAKWVVAALVALVALAVWRRQVQVAERPSTPTSEGVEGDRAVVLGYLWRAGPDAPVYLELPHAMMGFVRFRLEGPQAAALAERAPTGELPPVRVLGSHSMRSAVVVCAVGRVDRDRMATEDSTRTRLAQTSWSELEPLLQDEMLGGVELPLRVEEVLWTGSPDQLGASLRSSYVTGLLDQAAAREEAGELERASALLSKAATMTARGIAGASAAEGAVFFMGDRGAHAPLAPLVQRARSLRALSRADRDPRAAAQAADHLATQVGPGYWAERPKLAASYRAAADRLRAKLGQGR